MKNKKINVDKRRTNILNLIKLNKDIKVEEIAKEMNVSTITVRRDFQALEENGLIERQYGSVTLLNNNDKDDTLNKIDKDRHKAILAISSYVAKNLINNNDTIFMNSGYTVKNICMFIPEDKNITIITNNLRIAELELPHNISIMLTGGEVSKAKKALIGEFTAPVINSVTAAKALIGVNGISIEGGLTTNNAQTVIVDKSMLANCIGPKIVVADHTKIGRRLNFHFSSINNISCIVTDNNAPENELMKFKALGIEVIVVDPLQEI